MERAMPWETEARRGQTGEVEPVAVGGESQWYVGDRYFPNHAHAALWRRVEADRRRDAEARAARVGRAA